jgi:hypothetical protein
MRCFICNLTEHRVNQCPGKSKEEITAVYEKFREHMKSSQSNTSFSSNVTTPKNNKKLNQQFRKTNNNAPRSIQQSSAAVDSGDTTTTVRFSSSPPSNDAKYCCYIEYNVNDDDSCMSSDDDLFGDDSSDDDMPLENEPVVQVQFDQMNEGNFLAPLHDIEAGFSHYIKHSVASSNGPTIDHYVPVENDSPLLTLLMNGMPHKFLRVNHYRHYQMQIIFKNLL